MGLGPHGLEPRCRFLPHYEGTTQLLERFRLGALQPASRLILTRTCRGVLVTLLHRRVSPLTCRTWTAGHHYAESTRRWGDAGTGGPRRRPSTYFQPLPGRPHPGALFRRLCGGRYVGRVSVDGAAVTVTENTSSSWGPEVRGLKGSCAVNGVAVGRGLECKVQCARLTCMLADRAGGGAGQACVCVNWPG